MDEAMVSYEEREREFWGDRSVEVVLLGSDSLESVEKIHSIYFPDRGFANGRIADLLSDLAEVAPKS